MLVGDTTLADQVFVKVIFAGGADVSDVSKRACEEFGLGAGAPSRCRLYLVREGRERALAVEADPSLAASILISANKLAADEPVVAGSWLLARVPPLPAGAGGGAPVLGAGAGGAAGGGSVSVSTAIGPLFESEARAALAQCLAEVCPWAATMTPIVTRSELEFQGRFRQADLFCYVSESERDCAGACVRRPTDGVHIVWPDAERAEVTEAALPALALREGERFSPADARAVGPQKYFIGEAYSGVVLRVEKVRQLETIVDFVRRRLADRTGVDVPDATRVIGAAALVFSAAGDARPRVEQVSAALNLVRAHAGPNLLRLAAAGRLLLVLLSNDQAPQSLVARETTTAIKSVRDMVQATRVETAAALDALRQAVESAVARLPAVIE